MPDEDYVEQILSMYKEEDVDLKDFKTHIVALKRDMHFIATDFASSEIENDKRNEELTKQVKVLKMMIFIVAVIAIFGVLT